MNLFLKKNIFIETNRCNSVSRIKSVQINKLKQKIFSPTAKTISLRNMNHKLISSPKIALKYNPHLLRENHNSNISKKFFSAKKISLKLKNWKNNNSIILPAKEYLTQKEETKIKDERIESVLSEITNWDTKQLIENNENFKDAKLYCQNEKRLLNMQRIISEKNLNYSIAKTENDNKKDFKQSSSFSAFNTNFVSNLGKHTHTNKQNYTLNRGLDSEQAYNKFEAYNLDKLMKIFQYVKGNKIKKKKYKEVIDSTYNLIYQAQKECELSVDILKNRIKSLQKYYDAYIKSYSKIANSKEKKIKLYEEKIIKYREYLTIYEEISGEIKKYEDNYNSIRTDLTSFINEIKKKLEEINKDTNKYKYLFNELKEQQVEYYLDKLKKGEDTRKEGLTWIIKKLIELNANIDSNSFPGYLDREQIEYLIKISQLDFELHQLRIILKTFKDKKKDFLCGKSGKNKKINKIREKLKILKLKKVQNDDNSLAGDINFEIDFNSCFNQFLKEKEIKNPKIIEIQKKFKIKDGFSPFIKYTTEESKLNTITKRIRDKMNIYANTNDSKLFQGIQKRDVGNIDIETEYIKDFGLISDRIEKLDELIEKLKKDEYLIFKEKIKYLKEKERKNNYDKIYNALFGNVIFDIESKYKTVFTKIK